MHYFCSVHADWDIAYYTGFPSYDTLMTFWQYLGEKVDHLNLWQGGRETNITGEVTRGCRKQQLEALSPQGWFFTRGYFTGGVTRRNVCNGRVFPIECNTFEVRCCSPRYDPQSNNQTSAYVWRHTENCLLKWLQESYILPIRAHICSALSVKHTIKYDSSTIK